MHCGACVRRVQAAVGKVAGVTDVEVSVGRVAGALDTATLDDISAAITRAGYVPVAEGS